MTLLLLLVLGASSLMGCDLLPVAIVEPEAGARLSFKPVDIELEIGAGVDAAALAVWLNDVDISELFELTSHGEVTVARADDVWDSGLVIEGGNRIDVFVDGILTFRSFRAEGDPFADAVHGESPGEGGGYGEEGMPEVVLGSPRDGAPFLGSLDVLSLGAGGSIVLRFDDNYVIDGPGVDFTVFENAFFTHDLGRVGVPFAEPAQVSVSQDGELWFSFESCQLDPLEPPYYPGCAGVRPGYVGDPADLATPHASIPGLTSLEEIVGGWEDEFVPEGSGGDSFDLAETGLAWVRYVEIADVGPARGQEPTVGFDLDAVAAVNSRAWVDENSNEIPDREE
jgi:hypothetical protein